MVNKIVKFRTALGVSPPKVLKKQIDANQCYHNALAVIAHYPMADIELVEGKCRNLRTREMFVHVWNKFEGRYFDVTLELFNPNRDKFEYFSDIEGTIQTLTEQGYSFTPYWIPMCDQIRQAV
jgi:hypothetical protein